MLEQIIIIATLVIGIPGAIAAILAIIKHWDERRRLSVRVVSVERLLNTLPITIEGIELNLVGNPITNIFLFQIQISYGGTEILSHHIKSPLELTFSGVSRIVAAELTTSIKGLDIKATNGEKAVALSTDLLNPKDSFLYKVAVVQELDKNPTVAATLRIAGKIKLNLSMSPPAPPQIKRADLWITIFVLAFLLAVVLVAVSRGVL